MIGDRVGSGWKFSSSRAFGPMKMAGPRDNGLSDWPEFQPEISGRASPSNIARKNWAEKVGIVKNKAKKGQKVVILVFFYLAESRAR